MRDASRGRLSARAACLLLSASVLARALPAHGQACVVTGQHVPLDRVTVRPAGAPPFELRVRDATVSVSPAAGGAMPMNVRVETPLAFDAGSVGGQLRFRFAAAIAILDGAVQVVADTTLARVEPNGTSLRGNVRLRSGIAIDQVAVPCGAVVVDGAASRAPSVSTAAIAGSADAGAPAASPPDGGAPEYFVSTRDTLTLRSRAQGGVTVTLRIEYPPGTPFASRSTIGNLREVEHVSDAGERLHGWVAASDIRPRAVSDADRIDDLSLSGLHVSTPHDPMPDFTVPGYYVGRADVAAGARVYASAGRGAWATFPARTTVTVMHRAGEPWVRVTRITNVSTIGPDALGSVVHAYVPRTAVTFPAGVGAR